MGNGPLVRNIHVKHRDESLQWERTKIIKVKQSVAIKVKLNDDFTLEWCPFLELGPFSALKHSHQIAKIGRNK